MPLPVGSNEGSTVEFSESEIDDRRSKNYQETKHKDAKYKDKGMDTTQSESDNENSEVDESFLANFKLPSKTQHRNTKQATKHSHTKHSTNGMRKEKDSALYAATKSLSTRTDRANGQHERGVKRDRNLSEFQDRSTEESAESSAEMNVSSRASDGVKRKRLEKTSGLADTSNNESDIDLLEHLLSEHARSPVKDTVGGAMDGLTLGGDAPKTDSRTARSTNYDGSGDSMIEDNEEHEESEEGETR
ncbi:hypothetical protein N7472_003394 [Penicillium cf. griseofulvum]|uniref:Uncharacterized protein n=1 Tax=Penicillium cf. griseofulvum TaxID=2972120 RepID=A0A9W9T2K1_9EURO|nr:hypothetical protein N7472_003394 [Penicillium cf. griseofulvum]